MSHTRFIFVELATMIQLMTFSCISCAKRSKLLKTWKRALWSAFYISILWIPQGKGIDIQQSTVVWHPTYISDIQLYTRLTILMKTLHFSGVLTSTSSIQQWTYLLNGPHAGVAHCALMVILTLYFKSNYQVHFSKLLPTTVSDSMAAAARLPAWLIKAIGWWNSEQLSFPPF